MEKDLTARALRITAVLRVDLGIMRGELKTAHNIARVAGTQHDADVTRRALDAFDKVIRELDDPALFHPTLF